MNNITFTSRPSVRNVVRYIAHSEPEGYMVDSSDLING